MRTYSINLILYSILSGEFMLPLPYVYKEEKIVLFNVLKL